MSANLTAQQVIFGTGPLGLAVMDELVARSQEVLLVNRRGQLNESLPAGVSLTAADATDAAVVAQVCANATTVFFCAQPPYQRWPALFPPLITSVLDGLERTDAKLVVGSNLYMYGPTAGAPIHEALPHAAQTRKGRARAQVAQLLMAAHAQGKVPVTIGRAADFYGPRATESLVGEILFGAALQGKTVNLVGDIDLPHTLTYIGDFGRALVTLSTQEAAYGHAWHVPSAETVSLRHFVALVEAELGQPIKFRSSGKMMMRLVGLFNPAARETVEMMYEFEEPFVVDHSRYDAAFGNDVTPHADAIAATVAWYRQYLAEMR